MSSLGKFSFSSIEIQTRSSKNFYKVSSQISSQLLWFDASFKSSCNTTLEDIAPYSNAFYLLHPQIKFYSSSKETYADFSSIIAL